MIDKMTKYSFILLSGMKEAFLEKLKELGVVDITRSEKPIDELSSKLFLEAQQIKRQIDLIEKDNFSRDEAYVKLNSELKAAEIEYQKRSPWGEFDTEETEALAKAGFGLHFFCVPKKKFNEEWAESAALSIIKEDGYFVHFVIVGDFDKSIVSAKELTRIEGPASEMSGHIAELRTRLDAKEAELSAEKAQIPELKAKYNKVLEELDTYMAGLQAEGAADNSLCVFTGFAPSENDKRLSESFNETEGLYFTSEAASAEDNPPIKLKNNKFVKMFEVLTDMYGRPKYDGFDPTPYISIFFLLFFAMCIGDVGYGLVLVLIGVLLRKVKSFSALSPLVVTLGIGAAVAGFFAHNFFSIDIRQWSFIPEWMKTVMVPDTIGNYDGAMVFALGIGIIHLLLAMIVKTIYATKNKGFLNSLSTWGWTLFWLSVTVIGIIALIGVIDTSIAKTAIIVVGIICAIGIFPLNNLHRNPLINLGIGLWDSYNMATGILGDVLSYLRLYALGLAGAMLGSAFNELAEMTLGNGIIGWVAFALIALVGHTLNIAMAALGAFVHPLRLNFLEFFKNSDYDGSGLKYNPLKK